MHLSLDYRKKGSENFLKLSGGDHGFSDSLFLFYCCIGRCRSRQIGNLEKQHARDQCPMAWRLCKIQLDFTLGDYEVTIGFKLTVNDSSYPQDKRLPLIHSDQEEWPPVAGWPFILDCRDKCKKCFTDWDLPALVVNNLRRSFHPICHTSA